MDCVLTRSLYLDAGIFGQLSSTGGTFLANTLEHAYAQDDGTLKPKLPPGTYTCVRGPHQLHGMLAAFITFEITDVPGHTGILFHMGNYNKDSDGCVLLGEEAVPTSEPTMVTNSVVTFNSFMASQSGVDTFQLVVV